MKNLFVSYDRVRHDIFHYPFTFTRYTHSMSFVNDKIGSALECKFRELLPGEVHKRADGNMVYEATGQLNSLFESDLREGNLVASWKLDGTCCMIKDGILYRRLDIRKGAVAPPDAIMGELHGNKAKICWLRVNGSTKPEDVNHLSCITEGGYSTLDRHGNHVVLPLVADESYTFELIGPKVGGNPYGLPDSDDVVVTISKKGVATTRMIPRHYLVRHGDFTIDFPIDELLAAPNKVDWFRKYIVDAKVEGVVFRHKHTGTFYKINRGHIGVVEHRAGMYVLCPS